MFYDLTISLSKIEETILENIGRCLEEYSDCTIEKNDNGATQIIFSSEQSWKAFASTLSEEIHFSLQDLRYQLSKQLPLPETGNPQ